MKNKDLMVNGEPTSFKDHNEHKICFHSEDNLMGCLDIEKRTFEGNVEESAKIFFDYVVNSLSPNIVNVNDYVKHGIVKKSNIVAYDKICKKVIIIRSIDGGIVHHDGGSQTVGDVRPCTLKELQELFNVNEYN